MACAAILVLLGTGLAQAMPRAEVPYRYRMLALSVESGPIDPQANVLVVRDLAAVHLVDVTTHAIVRSLDLIPTVENDKILGYYCDLVARRIYVFQVAAVMVWNMDTGLVTDTFSLPEGIAGPPTKVRSDGAWLYNDFETGTLYRYDPLSRTGEYILSDRFIVEVSHDGTFALQQEVIETESTFTVVQIDTGAEVGTKTLTSIGIPQRLLNTSIIQRGAVLSHDGMYLGSWNLDSGALVIYRIDTGALVDEVDVTDYRADHLFGWGPSGLLLQNLGFNRGVYTAGLYRYSPDSPGVLQSYDLPGYHYLASSISEDGAMVYGGGAELASAGVFPATGQSWVNAIELESGNVVTNVTVISQYLGDIIQAAQADVIGVVGELGFSTWNTAGAMTSFRWNASNYLFRQPSISPLGDLLASCAEFQCTAFELTELEGDSASRTFWFDEPGAETAQRYVDSSFSPDGKLLLVRGAIDHILMRVPEGEVVERFSSPEPLGFTGFDERDVLFRLGAKGEQSLLMAAPIYDRTAVRFTIPEPDFVDDPIISSDGLRLYGIGSSTSLISEVSVTDGSSRTIPVEGGSALRKIAVSPDGLLLAAVTATEVQVIRLDTLAVQQRIREVSRSVPAFTPDSHWLLVQGDSVTQWPVSRNTCFETCVDEELDTDGDGLSDCYERCSNIRPWNADTDGDGMTDGDEVANGTDPTTSDQVLEGAVDGEGIAEGIVEGAAEGNPEGTLDGAEEGVNEGAVEGATEGVAEGTFEGSAEGTSEGSHEGEGIVEGVAEGLTEGGEEGMPDGEVEGVVEGGAEGIAEGSADGEGNPEGIQEGSAEGEGQSEGAPTEEGEGEGDVEPGPPSGIQCRGADGEPVSLWEFLGDFLVLGALVLVLWRLRHPVAG